jgi:hypothetical protein
MKRKMDKQEKTRRQAWRDQAQGAPSKDRVHHLTKRERLAVQGDPKVTVLIDMRERLADLFKGTTYVGPKVRVTHKQAFETRKLKRTAKALTDIAMEDHEARVDALTTKIDAAELER